MPTHGISILTCLPVLNAAAHGRSLATLLHPEIVFTRLFGSIAEGETRSSFQARANVLDYIKDDVKRARRELGSVENEKMDAYLSAYERLDTTSKRLVESRETLEQVVPKRTDKFSSKIETDRLDAHFELATAALIGGLTARRSPRELVFPTSISPSAD